MKVIFNDQEYDSNVKTEREALIDAVRKESEGLEASSNPELATPEDRLSQIIALIEDKDFEALKEAKVDPVNFTGRFKIIVKPLVEALDEEGYKYDIVDDGKAIEIDVNGKKVHVSTKSVIPDEEGLYEGQGIYSENGKVRKEQLDAWDIVFEKNHDEFYSFENPGNVTFEGKDAMK